MTKFKYKAGDVVYFRTGRSPLLKGEVVDVKAVPSGCLFGLIKWEEIQVRVQVPGQAWSLWKLEQDVYRDIFDYERAMHG